MTDDEYQSAIVGNYRLMLSHAIRVASDLDPEDVAQEFCVDMLRREKCRTRKVPFNQVVRYEIRVTAQMLRNSRRAWCRWAMPAGDVRSAAAGVPHDEPTALPPAVTGELAKVKPAMQEAVQKYLSGVEVSNGDARRVSQAVVLVRKALGLPIPHPRNYRKGHQPRGRAEVRVRAVQCGPVSL